MRPGEHLGEVERGFRAYRFPQGNSMLQVVLAVSRYFELIVSLENWCRICGGLAHTTRSKSMRRDLSLVNSCSSLHFPLAAGLLGVLARELVSDFGVDMARPNCSATSAELAAARLGHY